MRNLYLLFIISTCILSMQCNPSHKITYNIPADYPELRRKQLIEQCEKGKELYKENCSECHGIFTKGKDKIPNFTKAQFDNYTLRYMKGDPKNHAVAKKMSPEQLTQVMTFLRYKNPGKPDTTSATKVPRKHF